MKKKLILYASIVLFFQLLTLVFLLVHAGIYSECSFFDKLLVLWHSLPHNLSVTAWMLLPVFFVGIPYVWIRGDWHRLFIIFFVTLVSVPVIFLWLFDLVLYGYWGFRLDTTPLIYLFDDPLTALQESPVWTSIMCVLVLAFLIWGIYNIMKLVYPRRRSGSSTCMSHGRAQQREGIYNILLTVAMLIIGVYPTMGSAYFSDQQALNHAATNPVFSFFHSVRQQRVPLSEQYQFMTEEEMQQALKNLNQPVVLADTVPDSLKAELPVMDYSLLSRSHPDILLILFESFSGSVCQYLHDEADPTIMPNVNRAMQEGVAFKNFYANSFRTERSLVSVLSSYPGQPTYTVMNDTLRSANLGFLPRVLADEAGYEFNFVHGGDATFTHLTEYLRYAGATKVTDRKDFPENLQQCIWGVHDDQMFSYLADQLLVHDTIAHAPRFTAMLTLSSHEPFDVPFERFPDDPYLNSVSYADSCFGAFIDRIKSDTAVWNNLLIIGMPDHCHAQYPSGIQQSDPLRYHIPMFWTGGAVNQHVDIEALGSQVDLSATLIAQMHRANGSVNTQSYPQSLPFSHDILSADAPHYAFLAWPDGFGLITPKGSYTQDNNYDLHPLVGSNDPDGALGQEGRAYLQYLYKDLSSKDK